MGGPIKKKFFQKVITHLDATFLGQKFFSKTNILGSQFFSDPLGPKIRKIAEIGLYGPLFFLANLHFLNPLDILVEKVHGKEGPWGLQYTPLYLPNYDEWRNRLDLLC